MKTPDAADDERLFHFTFCILIDFGILYLFVSTPISEWKLS
jgi:hypothetical protein